MPMKPIDWIVIAVIAVIVGLVVFYIRRSRKNGIKCIGCPDAKTCSGNCAGCPGHCSGK